MVQTTTEQSEIPGKVRFQIFLKHAEVITQKQRERQQKNWKSSIYGKQSIWT